MNMEQLRFFIEVAESGSFSEAAVRLFTTQSSVSKHIQALEKELHVSLFDRSKRKIVLTKAGEIALKDSKRILSLERHLLSSIEEYTHQVNQELKIASIPVMAQYDITGLIAGFSNAHPEIHLSIQEIEGIEIAKRLKKQEFDFAFMRTDHLDHSFESVPIFRDRMAVVLPKEHPLANQSQVSLEQLSKENFLLLNQSTLLYDISTQACKAAGFLPKVTYTGTRMDTILGLVGRNQGISLMMTHAVSNVHHDSICIIPLRETIESTIALVRLKKRPLSEEDNTFWKFVLFQYGIDCPTI
jgi:DNA-binding transcriptional LysR family regulator